MRLEKLREAVMEAAAARWADAKGPQTRAKTQSRVFHSLSLVGSPQWVQRVLDVEKGKICWVIGTVYKDMPLKDNVLTDLAKDVSRYTWDHD